ncbi:MAG TPA: TetR family transcriptional regulator C-terminal domain-containing protein [Pseudonocardia sp.]|nr:TetR family transcriptional regulator C-terminal domain-containing protein [Pseudonocardia sp.]
MPRPPNPQVRERLLDVGVDLMHASGFHASGVKEITDRAGVPKGSFYFYYSSKEEFAAAVLARYWADIDRSHSPVLQRPGELLAVLREYFHSLADEHANRDFTLGCLIANLALECASSSPIAVRLRGILRAWEGLVADCLLRHGTVAAGDDEPDTLARDRAAALIEAWEGAVIRGKIEASRAPYDRFEQQTLPRLLGLTANI